MQWFLFFRERGIFSNRKFREICVLLRICMFLVVEELREYLS